MTALEGLELGPAPFALFATTVNVYDLPLVNSQMVQVVVVCWPVWRHSARRPPHSTAARALCIAIPAHVNRMSLIEGDNGL